MVRPEVTKSNALILAGGVVSRLVGDDSGMAIAHQTPIWQPPCALLDADAPFAIERNLTRVHQVLADAHPAWREANCQHVQFPAGLSAIQDGDLFAGRWWQQAVVFSAKPAGPDLVGYSCNEDRIRREMAGWSLSDADCDELEAMLWYWREQGPKAQLCQAYSDWIRHRLPSDQWNDGRFPAAPLYRLAGLYLDFDKLLTLGLPGLRAVVQNRAEADPDGDQQLYAAWALNIEVVTRSAQAMAAQAEAQAAQADAERVADLQRIAASCRAICERAPETLHEALQLVVLYKTIATVENWGRMDDYAGPFLQADLDAGRLDEAEALRLLCSLWRLIAETGAQVNERVIIGGRGRRHPTVADGFGRLAIVASRRTGDILPQLSLRLDDTQDPQLYQDALDALGAGCTFPILYNDAVNIPAVQRAYGVDAQNAQHYLPFGCGEYVLNHRSVGTPSGIINCAKVLELVLNNGVCRETGERCCPGYGRLTEYPDFAALWQAYDATMTWYLEALAEQQKLEYEHCARAAGYNLASLLMDDCIARGRSLLAGGVQHLGGTMESYGQITAADSLYAIKTLVFDRQQIDAAILQQALRDDFVGHDNLRAQLRGLTYYGNDVDESDAMAIRVHEHVCQCTAQQAARVGLDSYLVVVINNGANVILGKATGASANGRVAGAPLNNGNNPSDGDDRRGLTALLRSLVKLDPSLHAGAAQNMKLERAMFHGPKRQLLEQALATYFASGGAQAMLTVVAATDLRVAMAQPEAWQHLVVRVGGFSARFVNLDRACQEHILARTLHGG